MPSLPAGVAHSLRPADTAAAASARRRLRKRTGRRAHRCVDSRHLRTALRAVAARPLPGRATHAAVVAKELAGLGVAAGRPPWRPAHVLFWRVVVPIRTLLRACLLTTGRLIGLPTMRHHRWRLGTFRLAHLPLALLLPPARACPSGSGPGPRWPPVARRRPAAGARVRLLPAARAAGQQEPAPGAGVVLVVGAAADVADGHVLGAVGPLVVLLAAFLAEGRQPVAAHPAALPPLAGLRLRRPEHLRRRPDERVTHGAAHDKFGPLSALGRRVEAAVVHRDWGGGVVAGRLLLRLLRLQLSAELGARRPHPRDAPPSTPTATSGRVVCGEVFPPVRVPAARGARGRWAGGGGRSAVDAVVPR